MPLKTSITLSDPNSKVSVGIYFSGEILKGHEGLQRKKHLFDKDVTMRASSSEAKEPAAESGMLSRISTMDDVIMEAAPHAVQSDEGFCLGIRSTNFKGFKTVIFEFENSDIGRRTIEYCMDVFGNGEMIHILFYSAPIESFAENMDAAVDIFNTTVWRTDFDPYKNIEVTS